jgi:hypothetical protein
MKNVTYKVLGVIGIIGLVILAFINVVGIGYGLYLWGSVGHEFGYAVWEGFKVWISGIGIGLVMILPAVFTGIIGRKPW